MCGSEKLNSGVVTSAEWIAFAVLCNVHWFVWVNWHLHYGLLTYAFHVSLPQLHLRFCLEKS